MMTESGPVCDVCRKHILGVGVDVGLMEIWNCPGIPALLCHQERCGDKFTELKLRIVQAMYGELHSWVLWLLAGNKATWEDDISGPLAKCISDAATGFYNEIDASEEKVGTA